jgi:hypothetical protein
VHGARLPCPLQHRGTAPRRLRLLGFAHVGSSADPVWSVGGATAIASRSLVTGVRRSPQGLLSHTPSANSPPSLVRARLPLGGICCGGARVPGPLPEWNARSPLAVAGGMRLSDWRTACFPLAHPFPVGGRPFPVGGRPFPVGGRPFPVGGPTVPVGGPPVHLAAGSIAVQGAFEAPAPTYRRLLHNPRTHHPMPGVRHPGVAPT